MEEKMKKIKMKKKNYWIINYFKIDCPINIEGIIDLNKRIK